MLLLASPRAGSTGSRNGQSEGNLDQVIGIGGKRVRRRKGSEGIGGWLEEVRRQERGVVVIVVHLGKESMSERRPKKIIKNRKKKIPEHHSMPNGGLVRYGLALLPPLPILATSQSKWRPSLQFLFGMVLDPVTAALCLLSVSGLAIPPDG